MAITVAQIPAAITTIQALQSTLGTMQLLLNQAQALAANNWQVDIGNASTVSLVVTITPAQQQAMINEYTTLKANLVTAFNTLP